MSSLFKKEWEKIEQKNNMPQKLNDVVEYEFAEFKSEVENQNAEFVEKIVSSLYSGDAYIIRNAFTKEFLETLKEQTYQWGQTTESSFHKCLEGSPNFNRKIDETLDGQYKSKSIWHQHLFYRWNGDPFNLFEPIYEKWRVMKTLWGLAPDAYEKNTPKDGVVDRIHIYRYPHGGGYLATHSDPYKFQKTIMVVKMSEKGVEYENGGLYFIDKNDNRVNIEDKINVGDLYFTFPTVLHGVEAIDPEKNVNWNDKKGRWILGFYTMNSDHINERHTVETIEGY